MPTQQTFTFKIADQKWEFEQIHRLNYKTFVEEIPQHPANPDGRLVDKFHHQNTYLICLRGQQLVGMMAVRDQRPFSLDYKLDNLDSYLPPHRAVCEVRLLATDQQARSPRILPGLGRLFEQYAAQKGYDLALISGTVRQARLYRAMGFEPFGPLTGSGDAQFQPMYLSFENYRKRFHDRFHTLVDEAESLNLLPGPVAISAPVRTAFASEAISHRSRRFMADFAATQQRLCHLVHAQHVAILSGSGSLANDAVGAHLATMPGPGLVLSNGEFGRRLIDHATRWQLDFLTIQSGWGAELDLPGVAKTLRTHSSIQWLWAVHCETSSGILNDLRVLKELCQENGVRLCLDCISSIGAVPVDVRSTYLATGVSGKALGAYPGLSLVFYNEPIAAQPERIPRYLDLGTYAACQGVPFTISSNLVYALAAAVERFTPQFFADTAALSAWLRTELTMHGFTLVGSLQNTSPAVITIALPPDLDSVHIGDRLEDAGCLLNYRSAYLVERNWIQLYLVGGMWTEEKLKIFVERLEALTKF